MSTIIETVYDIATGETITREVPAPQPVAPAIVTMRQARLALLAASLLDDVENAIETIPDIVARRAARIEWEYAADVRRESPLIAQLGPALGLTNEQIDDLFILAATL